jgi:2-dehydro-3-deoxygluconokinase
MDVVTFGETMVLFTAGSYGPLRFARQFDKSIGGAEANMSIALARLGHQVGWISRLGNDEFGLYIRDFIRGEGVDTSQVKFDSAFPTAVFFKERQVAQDPKVYYYRKGSAASEMSTDDLDEEYISQAKYLHITGITPALSESCKEMMFAAIKMARKHGLTVVFDPNIRLKLWSKEQARETLMKIAGLCDIVLPGIEEGELLTGETDPQKIATAFLNNGAKMVVIKLGAAGAFYANADHQETVPGFPVKQVVDTVGAGDGFAAGFLSGLLRGYSTYESVRLGNRIGSYAVTTVGDVEGYPYWSQVDPAAEQEVKR